MTGQPDNGVDFFFDESGRGFDSNGAPLSALYVPDPTGGIVGRNVLIYLLPQNFGTVDSGDVRIFEPGAGGALSDVLRFTNAAGQIDDGNGNIRTDADRFVFYSDADNSVLADSGIPTLRPFNEGFADGGGVTEVGSEGNNIFDYGFYHGVSDVPEPASLTLLGAGLAGFGLLRRRKRA